MQILRDLTPTPENQEIIYNGLVAFLLKVCYTSRL